MSILNSLLNNKKVRTQKLHITNSSIFRKIRNLLFYRNLLQPRQCSDMRFLCPNPYVIKVMNAKLTHPYLFIVDFLNKPRQSWSRIDLWLNILILSWSYSCLTFPKFFGYIFTTLYTSNRRSRFAYEGNCKVYILFM